MAISNVGSRWRGLCHPPVRRKARSGERTGLSCERYVQLEGWDLCVSRRTLLAELAAYQPEMGRLVMEALAAGHKEGARFHPAAVRCAAISGESIDYAVMENTARAAMVPMDMGWSDIGNRAALAEVLAHKADTAGNVVRAGAVDLTDCSGIVALREGPRISAAGLTDVCIIVAKGEVLVTTREGAQAVGKLPGEAGKEECWLVLDAEPDARLAIGFEREVTPDEIAAAAADGTIEHLLTWYPARADDLFYLPAGTVHAIGPGLALVKVQQNSDNTFRLYDYGRPRDLHLEAGLSVAKGEPYEAEHRRTIAEGAVLVDGPLFRLDRIEGAPNADTHTAWQTALLAVPLAGEVAARDGSARADAGDCLFAENLASLNFDRAEVTLLTCACLPA
jgi:mannose-6-phosphate isomerase